MKLSIRKKMYLLEEKTQQLSFWCAQEPIYGLLVCVKSGNFTL